MPIKFLVTKIETCPKCEGKKFVQHPAWAAYWAVNSIHTINTVKEDRQWFEDNGWGIDEDTVDGLPFEEIICGECEGEGEITSQVDLQTALAAIKDAL